MRYRSIRLALILLPVLAYGKEPKAYQSGEVLQMASVSCGLATKDARSSTGGSTGTDSAHTKTQELLCQEYLLQTEKVDYRIRPKDAKHSVLLPVGERAQFRLDKNKMLVRVEDLDRKEREFWVVSMTPRSESTADASPVHLNHLQ